MQRLPQSFGILRPGYMHHEYIILADVTEGTLDGESWDFLTYLPFRGSLHKLDITEEHKKTRICRVIGKDSRANPSTRTYLERGTGYIILPYQLQIQVQGMVIGLPLIHFHTTGFLPSTVLPSKKMLLTQEEIVDIQQTYARINPADHVEAPPALVITNTNTSTTTTTTSTVKAPTFVLDGYIKNELAKGTECPILSVPLQDCSSVALLSCYHIFDKEAIKKWVETKPCCPVCRANQPTILHTT
jgi:hypothetical protein